MFSDRTKLSLAQYLDLQDNDLISVLFEKHGVYYYGYGLSYIANAVKEADPDKLHSLLNEITATRYDLRNNISPRNRYDQRWDDLEGCLALDGYRIDGRLMVPADPTIEGAEPLDDDLTSILRESYIEGADEIITLLTQSSDAFRRSPPDYNACLTDARVALQTIATSIAKERRNSHAGNFDQTKWGQVLAYLRKSGLITDQEEDGLSGVFSFVSTGAHNPVGLSEQEMARLGRSLSIGMIYFLAKRFSDAD